MEYGESVDVEEISKQFKRCLYVYAAYSILVTTVALTIIGFRYRKAKRSESSLCNKIRENIDLEGGHQIGGTRLWEGERVLVRSKGGNEKELVLVGKELRVEETIVGKGQLRIVDQEGRKKCGMELEDEEKVVVTAQQGKWDEKGRWKLRKWNFDGRFPEMCIRDGLEPLRQPYDEEQEATVETNEEQENAVVVVERIKIEKKSMVL